MLNCGNNSALDSLTGKADEIKAKLAEGMSALSDLESKAGEITSALNDFAASIPTVNSLQADLNTALTQATTDASAAFATFREKWGDAIPESEIQGYLDTISSIASNPLSLADFDPCKAFPNKELNPTTGAVAVKAKAASVPNTNNTLPEPYTSTITKKYENKITDEMRAATQAGFDNLNAQATYFAEQRKPLTAKRETIANDSGYKSALKRAEAAGKKTKQLLEEGSLTEAEAKGVEKALAWNKENEILKVRDYLMTLQLISYKSLLDGSRPQETYDNEANHPDSYLNRGKNDAIPQSDIDKFYELAAVLDGVKTGLIQWKEYIDERS